jgi:hypothetical protein
MTSVKIWTIPQNNAAFQKVEIIQGMTRSKMGRKAMDRERRN